MYRLGMEIGCDDVMLCFWAGYTGYPVLLCTVCLVYLGILGETKSLVVLKELSTDDFGIIKCAKHRAGDL